MYPYGLIGNCQTAALIDDQGTIQWLCMPRPDSPPIFGKLLDPTGGHFSIRSVATAKATQAYLPNTVILTTHFKTQDGAEFKVTDFCPRFYQHGRIFRPASLFRIVEPVVGAPTIQVSCRPVTGWDKEAAGAVRGNSHFRFDLKREDGADALRLTTNMPLTYLQEETPFVVSEPLYFALTYGSPIEEDLAQVSQRFLSQTVDYWNTWVKHCSIPSQYQRETIRSALTLKLHCYEDTGAILAAITTSLPEEPGGVRNWDYRYCWLRDAYFVLSAFHNLGHFEEMEGFLHFLFNLAEKHDHSRERLRPVYRLDQSLPLPELEHTNWEGFAKSQPVRSGNQAAEHVQNDVYGEMILTLSPIFFDERFHHLRTKEHERLLVHLGKLCAKNVAQPDAGLWEFRSGQQAHSFSNLMCWAGLERISRIRERGFLSPLGQPAQLGFDLDAARTLAEQAIRSAVIEGSVRSALKDESLDASLLQMAPLGFPDAALVSETVSKIQAQLGLGQDESTNGFLYRYLRSDDFGKPKSAFLICSFWLVQALAKVGRIEEAKLAMTSAMKASNELGLFSEHFAPGTRTQLGNFPQAYSHVGQINAAFSVSPHWNEVL